MTDGQRDSLGEYIRRIADEMALRDWTFSVLSEPAEADESAHIDITYGRKHALIRVAHDFVEFRPAAQRHSIVHELVHCHLEPACSIFQNEVQDALGFASGSLLWAGFKRNVEYGVDGLADAIAPLLPLWDTDG